jgi:hypothetical protein
MEETTMKLMSFALGFGALGFTALAAVGCRTTHLGPNGRVKAAFAAQANQAKSGPGPGTGMDAADARAVMIQHQAPMAPAQGSRTPTISLGNNQ